MSSKRSRLQVIYDILDSVRQKKNKIKPTHIMYKANLSHQMMEDYLEDLIRKKFLKENKTTSGKTYSLTQKGFEYLDKYKLIIEFTDSFGLE